MVNQPTINQRIRDYLYGIYHTDRPFISQLGSSYNISDTTITVTDEDNWDVGDILENRDTDELMLVTAVTSNGTHQLTVIRGWNLSTKGASDGSDDTIAKNPRFSVEEIETSITHVLHALELWGLHTWGTGTVTKDSSKYYYELSETDILDQHGILSLYYVEDNTELPIYLPFHYQYNLGTGPTEYSQGRGITVLDWGNVANGEDAYFTYAKKIDSIADLPSRMEELVVYGVVTSVLGGTIGPATTDPGARSDRTIPPGQTSRDVRWFQVQWLLGVRNELALQGVERSRATTERTKFKRARRWRS